MILLVVLLQLPGFSDLIGAWIVLTGSSGNWWNERSRLELGRVPSSPFRGLAIAINICKKFCLIPNTKTKTILKRKTKTRRATVKHSSKKMKFA